VFDAIMQMEKNKSPGSEWLPGGVLSKNWEVVKNDLMDMFSAFHKGELPLFNLNFGMIILLPKKENAT
jgi:mannosylglycoprotein endo-beta-mannosidase